MTLEQRVALGQQAERLLLDETFISAAVAAGEWYKDALFRTKSGEMDKREEIFAEYKGFTRVLERLKAWKSDGMIAADEIKRS